MNKSILFLLLLFFNATFSQVQQTFFVDDVANIDIVTVNYCVDNDAKISEVTIIEEKTSYKNTEIIEAIIKNLKKIKYNSDSKLKNNCFEGVYTFINQKYKLAQVYEKDYHKCEKFKTGKFVYKSLWSKGTKIKRNKKKQREKNRTRRKEDWFKEKYRITWPSPCKYELQYITVNSKDKEFLIGESIKVEIIAIIDNGYVYKSTLLDSREYFGVILFDKD